ncbi:MAG: hypothetical protein K2R98_23325 [Gemmataceae bacterium]|nr:hypothetical protein [Gemmataceae bacterium]
MRLTLRTLLAYLDDTLEPAQARVIGQKVAESQVAQELMERIKQVVRRRRLTAPPATGPGSVDPNIVAEYLDNVLPADQLAEVEEAFLKSDIHLAEVTGCHQILTLFVDQPAEVPPTAKKRMYGLPKSKQKHAFRIKARQAALAALDEGDEDESAPTRGSALFRKDGAARRLAPLAGIVALVAVLALVIWQVLPGRTKPNESGQVAANDTKGGGDKTGDTQTEKKDPDKKDPDKKDPDKKDPDKKDPDNKDPIDKPVVDKPSTDRKALGKYVAVDKTPSVLLRRGEQDAWKRLKPNDALSSTETLVSLPGYRSELQLDSGVRVILWGNVPEYSTLPLLESEAMLHAPEAPFDADLTLLRGRVVLANLKPEGAARVKVRFVDEVWDLTLKEGDSVIALELGGRYLPGSPVSFKYDSVSGKATLATGVEGLVAFVDMLGLGGVTDVKIRYGKFEMGAPSLYHWNNTGGRSRGPQPLAQGVPKWYTDPVPTTPHAKDMTLALAELSQRISLEKPRPVDVALAEARKESRGAGLILSILCLGAVNDLGEMVNSLSDKQPEVRWATIWTLTQWISHRAENDLLLFEALRKGRYSAEDARNIIALLHDFSEEDGGKPETYQALIDYLRHDKLVIRELSWRHLIRLWPDGRKIRYDPNGTPEMRDAGANEWRSKIPPGNLPPRPKAS